MRVLVCGGRNFNNYDLLRKVLHDMFVIYDEQPFPHLPEDFVLIQGGANGADSLADQWASVYGVASKVFRAEWSKYGKAAGAIRNKRMLDEGKPDLVIAFPGGKGTANMVQCAIDAGVPVRVIQDN